jgi:hypothetical protein
MGTAEEVPGRPSGAQRTSNLGVRYAETIGVRLPRYSSSATPSTGEIFYKATKDHLLSKGTELFFFGDGDWAESNLASEQMKDQTGAWLSWKVEESAGTDHDHIHRGQDK